MYRWAKSEMYKTIKHIINLDKKYRNFGVKLILQHFPYAPSLPQPKKKASLSTNSPTLSLILANSQAPCRGSLTSLLLITTPPAGFHLHVSAALPLPHRKPRLFSCTAGRPLTQVPASNAGPI